MSETPVAADALAAEINKTKLDLRDLCEIEGLLPIYEERLEYFFGEEAYVGYSLKDWLQDVAVKNDLPGTTLAFRHISLVFAYIVDAHDKLSKSKLLSVQKRLQKAKSLMRKFRECLPDIYWDMRFRESNKAKVGGYTKDYYRKCNALLGQLEVNHHHEVDGRFAGVDFKSFGEAVSFAIEALIAEEDYRDPQLVKELRQYYPLAFKGFLSEEQGAADRFKGYVGFAWNE
jgi:hypothetical protein